MEFTTSTKLPGANDAAKGTLTFQIGANSGDTISFDVQDFTFSNFALAAVNVGKTGAAVVAAADLNSDYGFSGGASVTPAPSPVPALTFDLAEHADKALSSVDAMLQYVDSQRSSLGALQNRLESSIRVQSNVVTNESDARSRIRDTDFAEESANLSQQSIIQQAATSMLMQANARPQIGLSLLG